MEVVCDEHNIGGDGEYCGDNDAQLGLINVLYNETSGKEYVFRAVLFVLASGMFGLVRASPLAELFRPGSLVNQNAGVGSNFAMANYAWPRQKFC